MATIIDPISKKTITLYPYHRFGREATGCETQLSYEMASRLHALIYWDHYCWKLKDTSRNGTHVNGEFIRENRDVILHVGDTIKFGLDSPNWQIASCAKPARRLVPVDGNGPEIQIDRTVSLPSEDNPEVQIYLSTEGIWMKETIEHTYQLTHNEVVRTKDQEWIFIDIPSEIDTLDDDRALEDKSKNIKIIFRVSQDEKYIFIQMECGAHIYNFSKRAHHQLLLCLARVKLRHQDEGRAESEQGWLDVNDIDNKINKDEYHINVLVFRARQQLSDIADGYLRNVPIIERRSGQIRLAYSNIEILEDVAVGDNPTATI